MLTKPLSPHRALPDHSGSDPYNQIPPVAFIDPGTPQLPIDILRTLVAPHLMAADVCQLAKVCKGFNAIFRDRAYSSLTITCAEDGVFYADGDERLPCSDPEQVAEWAACDMDECAVRDLVLRFVPTPVAEAVINRVSHRVEHVKMVGMVVTPRMKLARCKSVELLPGQYSVPGENLFDEGGQDCTVWGPESLIHTPHVSLSYVYFSDWPNVLTLVRCVRCTHVNFIFPRLLRVVGVVPMFVRHGAPGGRLELHECSGTWLPQMFASEVVLVGCNLLSCYFLKCIGMRVRVTNTRFGDDRRHVIALLGAHLGRHSFRALGSVAEETITISCVTVGGLCFDVCGDGGFYP